MEEEKKKFDWKCKVKNAFRQAKRKLKKAKDDVVSFVTENPELSVAVATVTIPTVCKAVKAVSNTVSDKVEERHRKLTTYDRRTDEYLHLRRKMKPREQEELARRMELGEGKTMILRDLGLLK